MLVASYNTVMLKLSLFVNVIINLNSGETNSSQDMTHDLESVKRRSCAYQYS